MRHGASGLAARGPNAAASTPMKNSDTDRESISRRDFVQMAALAAAAGTARLGLKPATGRAAIAADQAPPGKPMIGFQAEVTYLLNYGIGRFLDDVQNRASVNALFLHSNLYDASWDGLDRAASPAGDFATAHPQYYRDVYMQPRGLHPGDFDLADAMGKIAAEARKRGVRIFAWMEEDNRPPLRIKGMDQLYEIDLYGRRTGGHPGGPCLNNPYFRNLIAGAIEDTVRSYDVDGLQRGSERQGPLGNALGAWHHGAKSDPGRTSCFCAHCAAKAAKQGIDINRASQLISRWNPSCGTAARESVRRMDIMWNSGGSCCGIPSCWSGKRSGRIACGKCSASSMPRPSRSNPGYRWDFTSGTILRSIRCTGPSRITARTRSMPIS